MHLYGEHVAQNFGKRLIVQTGKLSSGNSQIALKQLFLLLLGFFFFFGGIFCLFIVCFCLFFFLEGFRLLK